jgi:hypothetical protein
MDYDMFGNTKDININENTMSHLELKKNHSEDEC